jgi:putative sterol carrier protein
MEETLNRIKGLAEGSKPMGNTLKIKMDEGIIYINGTGDSNEVHQEDIEAQCTLVTSLDNFNSLMNGNLNPMMAVMTGKLKIEGDMGVAMKLTSLLG